MSTLTNRICWAEKCPPCACTDQNLGFSRHWDCVLYNAHGYLLKILRVTINTERKGFWFFLFFLFSFLMGVKTRPFCTAPDVATNLALSPGDWLEQSAALTVGGAAQRDSRKPESSISRENHLTWAFEYCTGGSQFPKCRVCPLKPSVLTLGMVLLPTALHWICYQQKHSDCSSLGTEEEVWNEGLEMLEHAPISLPVTVAVCHQPSHLKSSLPLLPVKQKSKRWHNALSHNIFTYCCSVLVGKIVLSATSHYSVKLNS